MQSNCRMQDCQWIEYPHQDGGNHPPPLSPPILYVEKTWALGFKCHESEMQWLEGQLMTSARHFTSGPQAKLHTPLFS